MRRDALGVSAADLFRLLVQAERCPEAADPVRLEPLGQAHGATRGALFTPCGPFFVKWTGPGAGVERLRGEAAGLRALLAAGACRVPEVLAEGPLPSGGYAFVLPWIDDQSGRSEAGRTLGACLAALHRNVEPEGRYGFVRPTPIGSFLQPNAWSDDWVVFYAERRLRPVMERLAALGRLPPERRRRLERLIDRLGNHLPRRPTASLLHGDFWGGNWLVDGRGEPVLIDPAVAYGDREMDLAMAALFGGFPPAFFAAYREAYPPEPGSEERRPLYQLYYLLLHLLFFGESYGPDVDSVLRRYVG
ncbi:MAG: fructosamine kinase family protein [Hydrogenibacillus schlegelii]|nr:fructosamine kinase family protein [Hydrogenibacillus schlegelii]